MGRGSASKTRQVTRYDRPRRGPGRRAGKHRSSRCQVRDLAVSRWPDCSASTPLNTTERTRLLYRIKIHRKRKGERTSFAETDYAALLDAAHQYLKAPIVAIWDNLNTHTSKAMRKLIAARDWLHIIRLPAYAPDLNPTEGVWSHVKHSLGNLAVTGVDHLATVVRNRLKRIQYRPDLLNAFLAQTGLTLEPEPP